MMNVTGVTVALTAKHVDPVMNEGLHGHTWVVTAFWPLDPPRDGRCLKAMLSQLLISLPDADSANAAINAGSKKRFPYYPPSANVRALMIADRIESHNSPATWERTP